MIRRALALPLVWLLLSANIALAQSHDPVAHPHGDPGLPDYAAPLKPPPQPSAPHPVQGGLKIPLPPPSDLTSTTQEPVCSQHGGFGGGLACKALLPSGDLALIWGWNGKVPITGFKVYQVVGATRTYVGAQANGASATLYIATPPAGGFQGLCYVATAYDATQESRPSAEFCVGAASTVRTLTLSPTQLRSVTQTATLAGGGCTSSPGEVSNCQSTVVIDGVANGAAPVVGMGSTGPTHMGVLFDLTPVMYKTVRSARLNLYVQISSIGPDANGQGATTNHFTSCIQQIGIGQDAWWTFTDSIDSLLVLDNVDEDGPSVSYDVTSIVNGWTQGPGQNFGFVLMGDRPVPSCATAFAPNSVQLVVEY